MGTNGRFKLNGRVWAKVCLLNTFKTVRVICKYPYWQIRNYLQVPLALCITQGAEGIKRVMEKPYWLLGEVLYVYIVGKGTCEYPLRYFCKYCTFN